MDTFGDIFEKAFVKQYTLSVKLARIIARKYIKLGYISEANTKLAIKIIHSQLENLETSGELLTSLGNGKLTITIDDDLLVPLYAGHFSKGTAEISNEDIELEEKLSGEVAQSMMTSFFNRTKDTLTIEWKNVSPQKIISIKNERTKFASKLREKWGEALDALDLLIDLCTDLGRVFNTTYRTEAVQQKDRKFDALIRIHARSCQVAKEIHTLLCAGFADGANARWRTLYELAVTADFLAEHSNITSERYLLHCDIEEYKLMESFQESAKKFGWSSIPKRNINAARKRSEWLIKQYGKTYESDYGWASPDIDANKVTFADLEAAIKRDNFKSPFKMSHKYVHASSYGTIYPLSASPVHNYLVVGRSIFGLNGPGQQTAQAICSVTGTLLTSKSQISNIISITALIPFRDEVWQKFDEVETRIRENLKRRKIKKIQISKLDADRFKFIFWRI
jgi:Family of unknown function (DUF5677)